MKLPQDVGPYATGAAFDQQLRVDIDTSRPAENRRTFLLDSARGRRVVHVGCLDHGPLIDAKIESGTWLHGELSKVARSCLGVDIDDEQIARLAAKHGVSNIVSHDFTRAPLQDERAADCDVVLVPDVLEHLQSPVSLLASLGASFPEATLVVTVPNAFAYDNFQRLVGGQEWVNSDHFVWYSPYTLVRTLAAAGWQVDSLHWLEYNPRAPTTGVRSFLKNLAMKKSPAFADTIGAVCRRRMPRA